MASHRLIDLSVLSCLLFFASLCLISSTSTVFSVDLPLNSSDKVSLGLYYESLCPYSANFVVNYLAKIFVDGLIDIVDLNLVPWGNAKLTGNSTFACQHGPWECLLNTVEACAISAWPDVNGHFTFVYCVESLVYEGKYTQWETCFEKLGLDPKPVADCYSNGQGKELELQYAAETNALEPPHTYVPWVVVDGQPLYEDYEDFIRYICKAYSGTAIPQTCSNLSLNSIRKGKVSFIKPVCYSDDTTESIRSGIKSWKR
ncbi:unnamed protein product [Ilex paraguariensis]|uniref:Gamma-interferon-inducible lysosomal thiol reductase n=1 Tax=Ilex paraguariensis TaxID=185542 RepID=A0ABC8TQR4_9AQUA